jgi:Ca-activated chloride channel family protein
LHDTLKVGHGVEARGQLGEQWQDRGPWLLLALLPLLALAFRRGWLLLLPLVMLPLWPRPAAATTWSDLWQRPDQQAAQALRQGQPKQAMQLAKDPAWRGAAAYRAGDFAAAAQALQGAPGADAQYNRGNALAKAGNYQEALAAYDRALKLDPAHADAKANRQAVEDWLRHQQKPKSGDQSGAANQQSTQGKPGNADNKPGQGKQGEQGKQDGQGKPQSGQPGSNGKPDASQQPSDKPATSSSTAGAQQPPPLTPQQQAEQAARTEQARKALQKQMDQALQAGQGKPTPERADKNVPHQLGTLDADNGQARLPPELRQALQRVPDDPGALLRRKFELEYRQRHGVPPQQDDQP